MTYSTRGACFGGLAWLTVACALAAGGLAVGCDDAGTGGSARTDGARDPGEVPASPPPAAALALTPGSGTFGSVVVGKTSAMPVEFILSNAPGAATSGPVAVEVTPAGDFTTTGCHGVRLAGGESCTISVLLAPTMAGPRMASLTTTATPGGSVSATLSGTGLSLQAPAIVPDNVAFGDVPVGTTTPPGRTFTVSNPGTAPTMFAVTVDNTDFTVAAPGCSMAVPAGGTCMVTVTFNPRSRGPKQAALVVTGAGGVATAPITGNGVDPARLVATPATATVFGSTGIVTAPLSIGVANAGDERSGDISASLTGANAADFMVASNTCTSPLNGGGSCAITVTMRASLSGRRVAALTVEGAPGGKATVMITGSAVITEYLLVISPHFGDFMSVEIGARSAPLSFTITNFTSLPTPGQIFVTSSNGEFAIVSNTCGAALPPMGTCTFDVVFAPTSAGPTTGSLTATGAGSVVAALRGIGVPQLDFSIAPRSNGFGSLAVNQKSTPVVFTVTNTGAIASGALTVAINGRAASQFEITASTCAAALPPAASCTITVRFGPTMSTPPDKAATLNVTASPGSGVSADLQGAALP